MSEYEFKGYDYEELLDAFGLRKRVDKIRKHLEKLNKLGAMDDDAFIAAHSNIAADMIRGRVRGSLAWDTAGNHQKLDPNVKKILIDFINALLAREPQTSSSRIINAVLEYATVDDDDEFFVMYFNLLLEEMWT